MWAERECLLLQSCQCPLISHSNSWLSVIHPPTHPVVSWLPTQLLISSSLVWTKVLIGVNKWAEIFPKEKTVLRIILATGMLELVYKVSIFSSNLAHFMFWLSDWEFEISMLYLHQRNLLNICLWFLWGGWTCFFHFWKRSPL